jgi:tRNA threonylcarbamoyladenosine biosynthesis protein TsaE
MEPTSPGLTAATAEEMRALGVRLGKVLRAGDVVALIGPLGSGKTTFAQGLAEGLEVPAERHVASPTFALVNEHPGRIPFVHADLYRVEREADLRELGLEAGYDQAATAIEWADRFASILPADHLELRFELCGGPGAAAEGVRRLLPRAGGERSRVLLGLFL